MVLFVRVWTTLVAFFLESEHLDVIGNEVDIGRLSSHVMNHSYLGINKHIFHFLSKHIEPLATLSTQDIAVDVVEGACISVVVVDDLDGMKHVFTGLTHR
jgi:hypothetical protein